VLGVSLRCSAGGCGLHRLVAEAIAGTPGSCSHGALGRPRAEQRGVCVRVRVSGGEPAVFCSTGNAHLFTEGILEALWRHRPNRMCRTISTKCDSFH